MKADEAIVLVGGLGTRLRAVVDDVPKPLAPVAGRPFLAWVLDHLARNRVRRVVLAAGYRSEQVADTIGAAWSGMTVDYSIESSPLGTGGAIRQACGKLSGNSAHVLNGDTFLRYDLQAMAEATTRADAAFGMALAWMSDTSRYGVVERRQDGIVSGFSEKARAGSGYINAGCYFLGPAAIEGLPPQAEAPWSLEEVVLPALAAAGDIYGHAETEGFIDIGVPEDYRRAQQLFGPSP